MKEVKHGVVSVVLPGSVNLPEESGKMSKKEVSRLLKAPHGMGVVAEHSASAIEKLGSSFTPPIGVTPASLRESGAESEEMERVINDLFVVLSKLKQGKLLIDHKTHLQLRKLKDLVRAQAKYNPELKILFGPLLTWFEKPSETRKESKAKARKLGREVSTSTQQVPIEVSEKPSLNLVTLPEVAS
jgi:hypothetical protein